MRLRKAKQHTAPETQMPTHPPPPKLPEVERTFFDILLRELYAGLQETEKAVRKAGKNLGGHPDEILQKCSRVRSTVAYAKALLRLENERQTPAAAPEQTELLPLINVTVNNLRKELLYAGVAIHRPDGQQPLPVTVTREPFLFLLEEMMGCCLRCAPNGKNLYINAKVIGHNTLLGMRTEGPARQQAPLIPLLSVQNISENQKMQETSVQESESSEPDYGFMMCQMLAVRAECAMRWESDEAGVRIFLTIPNQS